MTALICLSPLMLLAFVVGVVALSPRYGRRQATFVTISALFCSLIATVVVIRQVNFYIDNYEYNEDEIYPAEEWRKVISLNVTPIKLIYRPNKGVFVNTKQGEIQLTDVLPVCVVNGPISRYRSLTPPIELTSDPKIQLPLPPKQPLDQVILDILIQFNPTIDTDILGASSYAVYKNGEVWCTERVVQRGQAIGIGFAAGSGILLLNGSTVSFLGTFVLVIILSVIYLEVRLRIQKKSA